MRFARAAPPCSSPARAARARSSSRARIHQRARAPSRPFVAVNCARHPGDAARERALRPREGRVHRRHRRPARASSQLADGGTIFLDEIGDMPLAAAGEAAARAPGARVRAASAASAVEPVDVRVVAATNRDLEQAVAERPLPRGSLLPPQRRPDRAAAAARAPRGHPAARRSTSCSSSRRDERQARSSAISPEALRAPGATLARQRARARRTSSSAPSSSRAARLSTSRTCRAISSSQARGQRPTRRRTDDLDKELARIEKTFILEALRETHGVQSKAAKLLGINERSRGIA